MAVKAAENRAVMEAERKDAERKAKEAAEAAERERIASDTEHRKNINNEVLGCFLKNGFEKESAKTIISLIASGEIKHVKIEY